MAMDKLTFKICEAVHLGLDYSTTWGRRTAGR